MDVEDSRSNSFLHHKIMHIISAQVRKIGYLLITTIYITGAIQGVQLTAPHWFNTFWMITDKAIKFGTSSLKPKLYFSMELLVLCHIMGDVPHGFIWESKTGAWIVPNFKELLVEFNSANRTQKDQFSTKWLLKVFTWLKTSYVLLVATTSMLFGNIW